MAKPSPSQKVAQAEEAYNIYSQNVQALLEKMSDVVIEAEEQVKQSRIKQVIKKIKNLY